MKINTITGHLTVTNKKHITAMLDKKMLSAKVNTIHYHLTLNNDIYSVSIIKFESLTIGEKPKQTLFKATFKIN